MKRAVVLAALLAVGCSENSEIDVPRDIARKAPATDSYLRPLGAAVATGAAGDDDGYLRAFVAGFTSLTPENAMKWEVIHPELGEFDFEQADELVALARRTGKRVRGHPLVWDGQLPDWVTEGDWGPRELAAVLRRHVRAVVGRYRGRVEEWDVVNEPLAADGGWKQSVFFNVLGPKYVEIAFRAAHDADPDAHLFLNEIGTEHPGPKSEAVLRLAGELVRRGVPIHGVGYETHTTVLDFPRKRYLATQFATLASAGLGAAVTEMDVTIPPEGAPPQALALQARAYGEAARACAEAANCTGLTVWGVTDEYSWRGADQRPLAFDPDGRPKPAFAAIVQALARRR